MLQSLRNTIDVDPQEVKRLMKLMRKILLLLFSPTKPI